MKRLIESFRLCSVRSPCHQANSLLMYLLPSQHSSPGIVIGFQSLQITLLLAETLRTEGVEWPPQNLLLDRGVHISHSKHSLVSEFKSQWGQHCSKKQDSESCEIGARKIDRSIKCRERHEVHQWIRSNDSQPRFVDSVTLISNSRVLSGAPIHG